KAGVSITSPVIRSAVIQNGNFQVDSQGNLNIGGLFSVTSQGQLTIRYSNQNVGLVIRNDKIEVYDQNGRLAVRIGRLR
ncbi:phage tail protein, partial [Escherichia coli]|nr:phage tail protein [Escherichia coli]EHL8336788.1 phage tail protein [Escherichia coli]EIZ4846187.1 phage tail protein [Escherichia coli]ELV5270509.1 phage tail protein [Escherichia coli]